MLIGAVVVSHLPDDDEPVQARFGAPDLAWPAHQLPDRRSRIGERERGERLGRGVVHPHLASRGWAAQAGDLSRPATEGGPSVNGATPGPGGRCRRLPPRQRFDSGRGRRFGVVLDAPARRFRGPLG